MHGALLIPASLMASMIHSQMSSVVPNVQTGRVPPEAAAPERPADLRGVTPSETASSIDKPATAGTEPMTGYHAPVIKIGKPAKKGPHMQPRSASQPSLASAEREKDCSSSNQPDCRTPNGR